MLKLMSAQPDTHYFLWQLEVQLENFKAMSLTAENVHFIIGHHPVKGPRPEFIRMAEENKRYARFFFYPDTRERTYYVSSIRPHIIAKHLEKYPDFNKTPILYHDSDVIFTRPPDFDDLLNDDVWYASDTRNYIDSYYIRSFGKSILPEMCRIVDVDQALIEANDENAGGAQYIIKNSTAAYWKKVERDCEELYFHLQSNVWRYAEEWCTQTGNEMKEYPGIQAWCADMWCVYWNALRDGHAFRIAPSMNFIWPYAALEKWNDNSFYHDTGVLKEHKETLFKKDHHRNNAPYFVNLDHININACSIRYADIIQALGTTKKYHQPELTFLMLFTSNGPELHKNLASTIRFINRYFSTSKIIVFEVNPKQTLDKEKLPANVSYHFIKDRADVDVTFYNNMMAGVAISELICFCTPGALIYPDTLDRMCYEMLYSEFAFGIPFNHDHILVDEQQSRLFHHSFDIRDISFYKLEEKYAVTSNTMRHAFLCKREAFIKMGGDNERIQGNTGMEWEERVMRMRMLHHKILYGERPLLLLHGADTIIPSKKIRRNELEILKIATGESPALQLYSPAEITSAT